MVNGSVPDVSVGEEDQLCHVEKRAIRCEDATLFTGLLLPIHSHNKVPMYVTIPVSREEYFFEDL